MRSNARSSAALLSLYLSCLSARLCETESRSRLVSSMQERGRPSPGFGLLTLFALFQHRCLGRRGGGVKLAVGHPQGLALTPTPCAPRCECWKEGGRDTRFRTLAGGRPRLGCRSPFAHVDWALVRCDLTGWVHQERDHAAGRRGSYTKTISHPVSPSRLMPRPPGAGAGL